MRIAVITLAIAAAAAGSLLEISAGGPGQPTSGLVLVREVPGTEPVSVADDLPYLPGWPVKVASGSFAPSRGIALADFDGDGRLEVIMPTSARQVHVWSYDAMPYPGWPVSTDSMGQYAASVADVDRDGDYEIAVSTRGWMQGGQVYLFGEDGTLEAGWPFRGPHGGNFEDAPTLADIDADDTLEIIVGERDWPVGHLHVLRYDGTEYAGDWPQELDHVPAIGSAVGDINLDGIVEIVCGSYNSMFVFHPDGSTLPGWPRQVSGANFSYQSPALVDIDGDDTLEIVTAMHRDAPGCYVFRHDGSLQWSYGFARWTYCPPAVADLYRDGDPKVLCGVSGVVSGGANVLYAFDDIGSLLPGFPYFNPGGDAAEGNPAVVDLDADGDMEVVFTSNKLTSSDSAGFLNAVHHDGEPVAGWPLRPYGFTYLNGATVADVDGDDSLDIVAVSEYDGQLQVSIWEAGVPFERMSWEWPTYQFDMARTGLYRTSTSGVVVRRPGSQRSTGLELVPNVARPGQRLTANLAPGCAGTLKLYARSGAFTRLLARGDLDNRQPVDLPADLAAGVYFVRLDASGRAAAAKLVVR